MNGETKACMKCGIVLSLESFQISSAKGKKVVRAYCPDCLKKYYRDYAAKKREAKRQQIESPGPSSFQEFLR